MEENSAADAAPEMEGGGAHEVCPICAPHGAAARRRRPAAAQRPAWWPAARAAAHARAAAALESPRLHLAVIALVFLDLLLIFTELALGSFYCAGSESTPDAVHTAEEVLGWVSLSILSVFLLEQLAKLAVSGPRYFYTSAFHALDAFVVVVSFVLEAVLRGTLREAASLLVILRLWRLVRVAHAVAESVALEQHLALNKHHEAMTALRGEAAEARGEAARLRAALAARGSGAPAARPP